MKQIVYQTRDGHNINIGEPIWLIISSDISRCAFREDHIEHIKESGGAAFYHLYNAEEYLKDNYPDSECEYEIEVIKL